MIQDMHRTIVKKAVNIQRICAVAQNILSCKGITNFPELCFVADI